MSEQTIITYNKQELIDCHAKYVEKMRYEAMLPNLQNLMNASWANMKRATEKGVHVYSTDLGPLRNEDGSLATGGQANIAYRYLVDQLSRIGRFDYQRRLSHNVTLDGTKRCACGAHDTECPIVHGQSLNSGVRGARDKRQKAIFMSQHIGCQLYEGVDSVRELAGKNVPLDQAVIMRRKLVVNVIAAAPQ